MGKAYGDDLRCKFLSAYDRGTHSLSELSALFQVSLGWGKKVSAARGRTGQMERLAHRPGRKPRVGESGRRQIEAWFEAKPDLTLMEVQGKLRDEAAIQLSLPQIWHLLKKLGLRLKKSRSTPPSGTPKRTVSSAASSLNASGRLRRNA